MAYKPVKNLPQNIGIAIEIASMYVSVAELLVGLLPVWDTVSTSGLHMRSKEVCTKVNGLTAPEKWIYPLYFSTRGTPNPSYA